MKLILEELKFKKYILQENKFYKEKNIFYMAIKLN